jgi:predicted DCC family thiol-disulfide oxidoreductase YuxK
MQSTLTPTSVLYDGSCPICSREIAKYKKGDPLGQICWLDVSSANFVAPMGPSQEALMQRFHVIRPDGSIVSGAAAFVHVWEQLPSWRNLARLGRIPGMLNLMEFGYEMFLYFRPKLQRIFAQF